MKFKRNADRIVKEKQTLLVVYSKCSFFEVLFVFLSS